MTDRCPTCDTGPHYTPTPEPVACTTCPDDDLHLEGSPECRTVVCTSNPTPNGRPLQRRLYAGEKAAGWDPDDVNTLAEEIAHLHEEVSEIFRAWRLTKTATVDIDDNGKPEGVPAECADVAIGLFYIAERWGFDLLDAIEAKHAYNLRRSYAAEGRRLHEPQEQR